MAVLERLSRLSLTVPVIVQTAASGIGLSASAMRAGALDFLVKPASPERIKASLANALRIGALESEVLRMRLGRSGAATLSDIVMQSPSMERVHQLAERAARSSIPVLIEGERGVGKALLARAIHSSSARRGRPFVTVRCGDISAASIELVLFGERAEAFAPGGKLAEANGGTLVLDEIGTLPRETQERLARVLSANEADTPSSRSTRMDIRLIAATSRRLVDFVAEGGFRDDLFHRLNVFPIWLPPLRQRRADMPDLARSFLARLAAEAGQSGVAGISSAAMELLIAYDWPGNIAELERAIFRSVMLSAGGELSPVEFPSITGEVRPAAPTGRFGVAVQEQVGSEQTPASPPRPDRPAPARYGVARLLDERGEMRPFGVLEEEVIRFAIDHYRGRMSEVARRLGIGRSTLYRKIKDYGIASGATVAP